MPVSGQTELVINFERFCPKSAKLPVLYEGIFVNGPSKINLIIFVIKIYFSYIISAVFVRRI